MWLGRHTASGKVPSKRVDRPRGFLHTLLPTGGTAQPLGEVARHTSHLLKAVGIKTNRQRERVPVLTPVHRRTPR